MDGSPINGLMGISSSLDRNTNGVPVQGAKPGKRRLVTRREITAKIVI
jgi:hypothetical protein